MTASNPQGARSLLYKTSREKKTLFNKEFNQGSELNKNIRFALHDNNRKTHHVWNSYWMSRETNVSLCEMNQYVDLGN